jgi:hypothetical protein
MAGALALPAGASAAQAGVVVSGVSADAGTLARIHASGAKNVRVFAPWNVLEPQRGSFGSQIYNFDTFVNAVRGMGLNVYFVVTGTPSWASGGGPDNAAPPPALYADFLRRLAEHFRGRVMAYEVWNEPDGTVFWQGGASPAAYAALLRAAYPAAKGADPGARVGLGGLVGNDYRYVEDLYGAGIQGNFDFVAVHTDNDCIRTDPTQADRDVDGRVSRWAFTGYREVHQVMLDHGDDKPIWMSELGWSTTTAHCPAIPSQPGGVTPAQQATFLGHAYACLAADPYVEYASWFALSDYGPEENGPNRFGLYDLAGNARPSLGAFQRIANGVAPDRSCGLGVDRGAPGIALRTPTDAQNRSGDLAYDVTASDPDGVTTLAILVDGRLVRVTARTRLAGRWTGWRSIRFGPHTITVRASDVARNISTQQITVNKVPYGLGEAVPTRIALGLYGAGRSRSAAGQLYTLPHAARPLARGRITIRWERRSGPRWVRFGGGGAAAATRQVRSQRSFGPGQYRVVAEYGGYKSFRRTVARRAFRIA